MLFRSRTWRSKASASKVNGAPRLRKASSGSSKVLKVALVWWKPSFCLKLARHRGRRVGNGATCHGEDRDICDAMAGQVVQQGVGDGRFSRARYTGQCDENPSLGVRELLAPKKSLNALLEHRCCLLKAGGRAHIVWTGRASRHSSSHYGTAELRRDNQWKVYTEAHAPTRPGTVNIVGCDVFISLCSER